MVTWEEIKEAEKYGYEEMEFYLHDILETAEAGYELLKVIHNNIEYLLEREGLYDDKKIGALLISPYGFRWVCPDEEGTYTCYYEARFKIYDKNGAFRASGIARGTMLPLDKKNNKFNVLDMTIIMDIEDVKSLKEFVEGLTLTA